MKVDEIIKDSVTIEVKHLNNTSGKNCNKCGSWIKHWENLSKSKSTKCSVNGCDKTENLEGCHVLKCDSNDRNHYIAPLCSEHNQSGEECFTITTTLITAVQCK